jgi:hypothetical protein
MAIRDGLINADSIVELGLQVDRKDLNRPTLYDKRLTIFDWSVVAVQDCVDAKMTYDALRSTFTL